MAGAVVIIGRKTAPLGFVSKCAGQAVPDMEDRLSLASGTADLRIGPDLPQLTPKAPPGELAITVKHYPD